MNLSPPPNTYFPFEGGFLKPFFLTALVFFFAANGRPQTWSPGTNDWNTAGNWSSPSAVPNAQSAVATFGTSGTTSVTLSSGVSVSAIQFNSGASAFVINTESSELAFFGSGIVNNSSALQNLVIATGGESDFYNTSTSGNANLTNNNILNFNNNAIGGNGVISNEGGATANFLNNATAGSAAIFNNFSSGTINFGNNSTAGSSTITNVGLVVFNQNATAGNAAVTNSLDFFFEGSSTAGNSNIVNNGSLNFNNNSSAEAATISNSATGNFSFFNDSTAGNSNITNNGTLSFSGQGDGVNFSTAGGATITNNNTMLFNDYSTAGNSTLTNAIGGGITFNNESTAGNSNVTNNGNMDFSGQGNGVSFSTAGSATITNNNSLSFSDYSTAGNAQMTNTNLSFINFLSNSTAGSAAILNNVGGNIRFFENSSAENAAITNANGGALDFEDDATAGNSNITNNGNLGFTGATSGVSFSTAGSAAITNNNVLIFNYYATAGNSTITNAAAGVFDFNGNSAAGSSKITNNGSLSFNGLGDGVNFSTAANSAVTNNGTINFNDYCTAANSTVANGSAGTLNFYNNSTAGNAVVVNNNVINLQGSSTAGNATLTTNRGYVLFQNTASGGSARFIFNGTGFLDISSETAGTPVTIGSIEGAGSVSLGGNNLATGSNNLSTFYSGIVADGGVVSGAGGSLTKIGTGTFTLSGTNSYTGGTDIDGGTLVAANSNALGTGSVLVNGGTLSLSGPRTLNIGGNYTQTSAGTLQLGLGGAVAWDRLAVTGSTVLGGTLKLFSYGGFYFHGDESFTLITSDSVTGTFSTVFNSTAADSVSLVYNSNDVILDTSAPSFESLGLTVNQKAVGLALDHLAFNSLDPTLILELSALTNSALPSIYDELSPSNLTPIYKMRFMDSQAQGQLVWQRLSAIWGNQNSHSANMAWDGQNPMFAGNMPADQEVQIAKNLQPDHWGGFLSGMNNFGAVTPDGNGAGYQFSSVGATAGADYRLAKDLAGGLLIGYDQSGSSQSTGTVNATGTQVGLYAGWKSDDFQIDAFVDGGIDSYSTQRTAFGGTAAGSPSGLEFSGQLNLGYDLWVSDYDLNLFLSGQLTQVNVNGFTETGSLAPLTFSNQSEAYLDSDLGFQLNHGWQMGTLKLSPSLTAVWEHVYQGNLDSLTANFGTGDNFTVLGSDTGTDAAVLGGGVNAEFAGGFSVYLDYQGKLGMTNFSEQSLSGGINVAFGGSSSKEIHATVKPAATPAATPLVTVSPVPTPKITPIPTPVVTPVVSPVETPFSLGPLVPTQGVIIILTPTATPVPPGSMISPLKSQGM